MPKTCIVVPCYNESERLPVETFEKFIGSNQYHFFFVNDASQDDTLILLENLKELFPNKVNLISLGKNSGKGEAVRQGFLAAISMNKYDCIGYLDADLATPLEEIEYLHKYLDKDRKVVIGSRVKRLGVSITRTPLRHYLGRIFATVASVVLDIEVYDSQCGAKIFRSTTAQILFAESFKSRWLFDLELLYRLKENNSQTFSGSVIEVPLRTWKEKKNSKMRIIDFLKAPFDLILIRKST